MLIERDDLAYLDTRALPWEPFPGLPGAQRKTLVRGDDGEPRVFICHLDPGFAVEDLPQRHYHSTVTELAFALAGELPHWEYRDRSQHHGTLVRHRPGYATHRLPGSSHGLAPGARTPVGFTALMIRDGTGTWPGEPRFADETVAVPFAPGWAPAPASEEARPDAASGVVVDWPDLHICDTDAMPWEPVGRYGHCKVLARDAEGRTLLTLQHVAPDFALPDHPTKHSHDHDQYDYVVWGEFPMAEYERESRRRDAILMKAGHFVHRRGGEIHGLVAGASSPTGCLSLQWYSDAAGRLVAGAGTTRDET